MAVDYFQEQLRLLRGAGWEAHAKEFEAVVIALRLIDTWARVEGRLDIDDVIKLASKALEPLNPKGRND